MKLSSQASCPALFVIQRSLKGKRGFEVDFLKKCMPGLHAWPYIFPKHDLVIKREFEFIWSLFCDTQAL